MCVYCCAHAPLFVCVDVCVRVLGACVVEAVWSHLAAIFLGRKWVHMLQEGKQPVTLTTGPGWSLQAGPERPERERERQAEGKRDPKKTKKQKKLCHPAWCFFI